MTIGPGAVIDVDVERPVAGGRMIARHEGQVVFVDGAIPGERVRARVTHRTGGATFAEVVEVTRPSADRAAEACDRACGGEVWRHICYERQRALKAEIVVDAFRRIARQPIESPPIVHAGAVEGYRLRARLHVSGARAGFLREGSHDLCDARTTGQLRPGAIDAVEALIARLGPAVDQVGAVAVAETVDGAGRLLHLEPRREHGRLTLTAVETGVPDVTGVTAFDGGRLRVVCGAATVTDEAAALGLAPPADEPDLRWTRHAVSFFQGNRFLVGPLAAAVAGHARADRVVDLYAGVGLFSLLMAAGGSEVVAVEGDRWSGADLSANAAPWRHRVLVVRGSVEEAVARRPATAPGVVVLDPPRTGVTRPALRGLLPWRAPRLVYVSCDAPTLARDTAAIVAAGYRLAAIECFDLFPHTAHVETVAVFDLVAQS